MNPTRPGRVRVSAGFTLVELMVSMIISMLLIIAIASLYLGQLRSYDTQSDLSLIQESARAIGQLLQRDARQAGYTDYVTLNRFDAATNIIDAVNDLGTNSSDTLSFRFYGSSTPGAATADGSIVDCTGTAAQNGTLVFETYSVVTNVTTGEPWLQCSVNGNAVPLFPGVEQFQVLFGEDTDGDLSIDRYVPAGVANMANVRVAQISVVIRGTNRSNVTAASATVNHFGTEYAPGNIAPNNDTGSVSVVPADGRLRKHFTYYVALRNRLN